jgi:hypothetical protein
MPTHDCPAWASPAPSRRRSAPTLIGGVGSGSGAPSRGFRYLLVDASADSRPILAGLGFVELATTTPFMHPGVAG